jgi:hypothetical protein
MQHVKKAVAFALNTHHTQLYFLLGTINFMAFIVYIVVHTGVYGLTFQWEQEINVLPKLFFTASLIAVTLHLLALLVIGIEKIAARQNAAYQKIKFTTLVVFVLSLFIAACSQQPVVKGIMKDFNTGVKTTYQNLKPEEVVLVMNGEVIHHTDIPLGEQFTLVNKNVKGLVQKDGRVSIGTSLTISDTAGRVLLNEPDLFAGKASFPVEEARYLKCIVSTGKPMNWDEHYTVKVRFWDKWGQGKVDNEFTIFINGELSQE